MLISDTRMLGNRLFTIRKRLGLTQAEVAERADMPYRTYTDIERGTVNTRMDTLLQICKGLQVTPNDILTVDSPNTKLSINEVVEKLEMCTPQERDTALRLLEVYFDSLTPPAEAE